MKDTILKQSMRAAKRSLKSVFAFSFFANLLLLTSPLFMLQVYDRVLLSRSEETLLALLCVAVLALVILYILEVVRNRILTRVAANFDKDMAHATFSTLLAKSGSSKPIHDLNGIRQFISSPFVLTLFDMPWMPLYLALVYFLHPMLGHIALVAVIILFGIALWNDRSTREAHLKAGQFFSGANRFAEHSVRNKDAVLGMGMTPALTQNWHDLQKGGLGFSAVAADQNAALASFAKVFRQFIQVAILAMGAYLTIQDLSTAGVMIAASIIAARALAPVEQSIQGWRSWSKTRESYTDLSEFMLQHHEDQASTQLPEPKGLISLHNVFAIPAINGQGEQGEEPLIRNVSLQLAPGTVLGIAGPSGSGKSTLMRLMAGVIKPLRGIVRIDGAELTHEVQAQFAKHIGFLPQDVELFDGTVAENIARFTEAPDEAVVKAAQMAGAHELILSLKEGYQTKVGPGGLNLSGGQRQRVGLARALFGDPKMVFLDEPNSSLDEPGTLSLIEAIKTIKQAMVSVVIIAHHPRLFLLADHLAVLNKGVLEKWGPTKDVLEALRAPAAQAKPAASASSNVAQKNLKPNLHAANTGIDGANAPKLNDENKGSEE
jgi:ATP-binding cassette subfamily C protein EexD